MFVLHSFCFVLHLFLLFLSLVPRVSAGWVSAVALSGQASVRLILLNPCHSQAGS